MNEQQSTIKAYNSFKQSLSAQWQLDKPSLLTNKLSLQILLTWPVIQRRWVALNTAFDDAMELKLIVLSRLLSSPLLFNQLNQIKQYSYAVYQ